MRDWGGLVGRNGADVRTTWGVSGVGWGRAGNVWRGRVTLFSGYGGAIESCVGEVVRPGCALGRTGTLAERYGEREAMAEGSELGAGAGCWRGRRFWARLVICNRLLVRNALAQIRRTVLTWQSNANLAKLCEKVNSVFKWAAIGDTPPFSESIEFEFDERVNVFIGPNATGKSTLLRSLAGAKYDLSGEERPKFVFDLFVGKTRTPLTAPHADLLQGPFETSLKRWESLGEVAERASGRLPIVHIAATRLSVPLSTDTPSIQQMLSERSDWESLADVLENSESFGVFDGSAVYHASQKIGEDLQAGRYGGPSIRQMIRVSRLPFACARAICSDVLRDSEEQFDWIQELPVGELGDEEYVVATVHHDMAVFTADNSPDGTDDGVFVGDLSAGTQGTLLWIWYLALRIASFYQDLGRRGGPRLTRTQWEKRPAILLIDEIENHLHPAWQRRVIPALLKYFPGLQIFATTHSPFVIAGLKAGQGHLLNRNDDGTVVASTSEQDIVGWTADEILRTFMGVDDPTDELTATNAARLRALRRKDTLEGLEDHERTELDELRTKAGADILAQGGLLNAQRERFAGMVQEFLRARLADTPPNEA